MAETAGKKEDKSLHSFPLIRHTDMPEETMELCVTASEKFATNNKSAAKMIKESMDKKFDIKNLLYMFFDGSLAVCV
uniref:Dynein light chain n=1 Tax=Denticeps clupeoides TaxID=299321 RepID=A0AAY4A3S8_9TELE